MKYIFISGGVISGLGKGIATASIALLLKAAGLRVVPMKMDPYLNVDAGTMNPIEHGETFVLDDGTETDQDLGHYERFTGVTLDRNSIATQGSIFLSVIQRERNLEYGGACVDMVTYITEEILSRIQRAGEAHQAEVVLIEIGGTTGEYQNMMFLEANRLLKLKHPGDVAHVHITYLPIPHSIGEMKSKPAQMSVRDLHAMGIQPDILLPRAEVALDESRIKKLAVTTGMEPEDIISAPDVKNVYEIPLNFENGNLTDRLLSKIGLQRKQHDLKEWRQFVASAESASKPLKVAIVGKYFATGSFSLADLYISVIEAIKHAAYIFGAKPEIAWIDAGQIDREGAELLKNYDGIIVPGGFGSRDIEGKIKAIQYAREHKIPYFGLCYGMQLACVEYARNVVGLANANTTEADETAKYPIIHIMPEQEKMLLDKNYGGTMRLGAWPCNLTKDTKVSAFYGKEAISERHRHRYEFNNEYREQFEEAGMTFAGLSPDSKLVEIIELLDHPFFVGTQFHPELKSRPLEPHPLFVGFVKAALKI